MEYYLNFGIFWIIYQNFWYLAGFFGIWQIFWHLAYFFKLLPKNHSNNNIIKSTKLETKVLSLDLIYVVTLVSSEEFRLLLPIFHRMLASLQVVSFSLIDIFLRA